MSGADAGPLVAHSQARMLHPAALLDFEAHVQGLLARGERDQAVRLWKEVVVVVHLPPTEVSEFRIHTLGSLREVPCMVAVHRDAWGVPVPVARSRGWPGGSLAQRLVTEAERAAVLNALRTWGEVITFMQARSRPLPPEVVDLDVFLHEGTAAPARYSIAALVDQAGEGGSGVGHARAACGTGASGRGQTQADSQSQGRCTTTMPASLNGRRLTAVMRDGKRLCPAFQAGHCPGERVCGFVHLCACIRLTGRACGGKHAAAFAGLGRCRPSRLGRRGPRAVARPVPKR